MVLMSADDAPDGPKDCWALLSLNWKRITLDWQLIQDIDGRLEKRLGRLHARLRLGIEADHEAQVFGHGINYFHIENLPPISYCHSFMPQADGLIRTRA